MLLTAEAAQAQINISGKVFGGARQANVGGHTYVNISAQKHDVIINAVYGGNDIAGTIGSSTKPSGVDDGNHIDGLGSYNSFVRTDKEAMGKHLFIGQLFGGGYGNYTYDNPDNGKFDVTVPNMKVWDENESNFKTQSITFQAVFKPELAKAYVDLHGGTFGYVYGGGDNVTVTANTQICINNESERTTSIKDKVMKDGSGNPLELEPIFAGEATLSPDASTDFMGCFVPTGIKSVRLRSTYDVYDKKDNLIREGCKAENAISLESVFGTSTPMQRGHRRTVTLKVDPTYLYMLSEPDLDNPTVKVAN